MRHNISDIKIERVEPKNGLLAFCEFKVDGFQFQSVAIFKRPNGNIRLSWPEKIRGQKKITTSFPIFPESAFEIESQIQIAFNQNAEVEK